MAIKRSNRCLFHSGFKEFIEADQFSILGRIHDAFHGQALTSTDEAWLGEIQLLQQALSPWKNEEAEIIFEYDIPRLGKRIDVVLLLRGLIFCLEFKVGQKDALQSDVEQVMDYALDLKNFHRYSHDHIIVPILIPTNHKSTSSTFTPSIYNDFIFNPLITGATGLQDLIQKVLLHANANTAGTIKDWIISPYTPTPTIIEAARSLYENHSVENIIRHEADNVTTDATIANVLEVINRSKRNREKSICFVTGVPGAGKTLVGLDVAVKQSYQADGTFNVDDGAVYLSGNGPLVAVLTEALARDNYAKSKEKGEDKKLSDSRREVSKFIQIIHRYRDNMLAKIKDPIINGNLEIDPDKAVKLHQSGYGEVEHVAIFDEAQRAWTHERIANYLKRGGTYGNKLKVDNFPMSEAAFLIWSLDRREDWATIVCLIGGGQEINTGEAGISEWIAALNDRFPHWKVYISNKLTEPEYAEGKVNELLDHNHNVIFSDKLHLGVSLRSFRAERLSAFVHAMLSFNPDAKALYTNVVSHGYPIVLTRSMDKARDWLRKQARGTQQTGILISKVSARFKPLAVHVLPQSEDNAVHWFLEDKTDVRSSNYLEEAATEIQVQGLEVDFACVLWDADMRCDNGKWTFWKFNGKTQWIPEKNNETQKYMLNAYRVLLTRARQGIIICVPEGNDKTTPEGFPEDHTRLPSYYNSTYNYFKKIGITEI
ncbi:MAG: DNA/RNA helicase domain-containing protein [Muribaculaceae bacterium]